MPSSSVQANVAGIYLVLTSHFGILFSVRTSLAIFVFIFFYFSVAQGLSLDKLMTAHSLCLHADGTHTHKYTHTTLMHCQVVVRPPPPPAVLGGETFCEHFGGGATHGGARTYTRGTRRIDFKWPKRPNLLV